MFQSMLLFLLIICLLILLLHGCPFLMDQQQLFANSNILNNLPADHHGRQLHGGPEHGPPPPPSQHIQSSQSSSYVPTSSSSPITVSTPSHPFCIKTNGEAPVYTTAGICAAYHGIKNDFYSQLPTDPFVLSDIYGQSIRLAFHDAAEADVTNINDLMGPDGCISHSEDNNGLIQPTSYVTTFFEPIWQMYCESISRGDFWSLIGILSVQKADPSHSISIPFQYGRVDSKNCSTGAGRLPSAQLGSTGLTQTFVNQLGLTLDDAG